MRNDISVNEKISGALQYHNFVVCKTIFMM